MFVLFVWTSDTFHWFIDETGKKKRKKKRCLRKFNSAETTFFFVFVFQSQLLFLFIYFFKWTCSRHCHGRFYCSPHPNCGSMLLGNYIFTLCYRFTVWFYVNVHKSGLEGMRLSKEKKNNNSKKKDGRYKSFPVESLMQKKKVWIKIFRN